MKALIFSLSMLGLAGAASLSPVAVAPAAACQNWDDVKRACRDDVNSPVKDVFRTKPSEGTKRATTVGGAVKDCMDCALDVIRNGTKVIQ